MSTGQASGPNGSKEATSRSRSAYGIGALVAGKLAAKAGLFAKFGVLLLALKKFWILLVLGVAGILARIFRRGRSKQSPATS